MSRYKLQKTRIAVHYNVQLCMYNNNNNINVIVCASVRNYYDKLSKRSQSGGPDNGRVHRVLPTQLCAPRGQLLAHRVFQTFPKRTGTPCINFRAPARKL
jgi:hypothetical protein